MTETSNALLTDLYQLTMLQAYFENGLEDTASFEFFVRRLPENRSFLVAAGLEQVLGYLENLRFTDQELDWIDQNELFTSAFTRRLEELRFTGDVHAMPEGTPFFANEPILRVSAPLPEAQLVESRIINLLHFQTLIASKAARCALAAPGKLLVDFGMRRAHGAEAAIMAARASYIAGFNGTSNVNAAQVFGIPAYGTMAHSFVQIHDDEAQSFERFAKSQPNNVVLLIDTYDTETATRKVVALAQRLKEHGTRIHGVRLDSGDLTAHAFSVRRILDEGGCSDITIFCSGSLDEHILADMMRHGAPVDGFGVGTSLDTSKDTPALDCAYKLVDYAGIPRRKRAEEKATLPGRKQVFRCFTPAGHMQDDLLTVDNDTYNELALIRPVMIGGQKTQEPEPLTVIRERVASNLSQLPAYCRKMNSTEAYPVRISAALQQMVQRVDRHVG